MYTSAVVVVVIFVVAPVRTRKRCDGVRDTGAPAVRAARRAIVLVVRAQHGASSTIHYRGCGVIQPLHFYLKRRRGIVKCSMFSCYISVRCTELCVYPRIIFLSGQEQPVRGVLADGRPLGSGRGQRAAARALVNPPPGCFCAWLER